MLPRKAKALSEEFRRGIASALGVEPEEVNPELVEKWTRGWYRAFLTPEAFRRIFGHSSPSYIETATKKLIEYILSLKEKKVVNHEDRRSKGL
ncbi:MAG: hypothetical protein QXD29_00810 [Thermoplasmata archaeon]